MKTKKPKKNAEPEKKPEFQRSRTNLFRRDNGRYYGRAMAFGKVHKKSFGKLGLEEAKEAHRKWMSQIHGWNYEVGSDVPKGTTLADCMAECEKLCLAENISYDHRRYIRSRFKFIREKWPEFGRLMPDAISAAEITSWIERMRTEGFSPATVKGSLLYMRKTFAYAEEHKVLFANPMLKITAPAAPPRGGERRRLSVEEFDLILTEMRKMKLPACRRAADLAELLAATGARLSEIAGKKTSNLPGLRWRDVDWENKQLTLYSAKGRVSKGKVGTPRLIPFHPRLVALLEKLKERSHTDETKVAPASTAKKSLFGAVKRLHKAGKIKFEKLSHHDLRHMFATWAIESGIDIPTVADLLGHRDGGALLLSTYRHLRNEHLQNAAKKLKGKA